MKIKMCNSISEGNFTINAPFDDGIIKLQMCCEACQIPTTDFGDTPMETFLKYFSLRTFVSGQIIKENSPCLKCIHCKEQNWDFSPVINYVNLSLYPSPCQSNCIYCNINQLWKTKWSKEWESNENIKNGYNKIFETLEFGIDNGLIHPDATWIIACGEITIHPYKNRIYDFVKGKKVKFLTNAFVFDETIADNLKTNPRSSIYVSIDAGTPQTWYDVKRVNNFNTIMLNLKKYHSYCLSNEQIGIKYIVLPDINDIYEDYVSVIEILKEFGISKLDISRNTITTYSLNKQQYDNLIGATAYLAALCKVNDITPVYTAFSMKEQHDINETIKEIVDKNLI